MRTKHLLYTAAIAAMFSACTNDDFMLDTPQNNVANDGRPTVSDVRLNFIGDDAETRVVFGKEGYAWEANDTIGALLMDNVDPDADNNSTWLEKYSLISNIHTSYPFTYSTAGETWGCNTKMLEGNYFFAYPWENYDGRREVVHSLLNQQQEGVASSVVAQSYADNQFFIGYSQIMAGTHNTDVLNDVEMVPVLGAIQLRITNTGTQTYHINKVVLSGNDNIASVLTFDPTNAVYDTSGKWNLTTDNTSFNYANYTGNQEDLYTAGGNYVYNIEEGDNYDRIEALRAVVSKHDGLSTEKSAQLTINGSKEERALTKDKVAYVLIMCNSFDVKNSGQGLNLSIYTDEGMVSGIDLSVIHAQSADYTVVTDSKVEKIAPNVTNTIGIQIDDNSFVVPEEMEIFNASDLLQYIKWNTQIAGARDVKAVLKQDVTFTKEMLDMLQTNSKTILEITNYDGTNYSNVKLTLAKDVPATVLDDAQLTIANTIPVVVEGQLALTEKSDKVASITVAEGAKLTINDAKAVLPATIENNGTLEIGENAAIAKGSTAITNNAVINVAKDADSKAAITNEANAVINNNGYMQNVTNNEDGQIVMGTGAILMSVTNSGLIQTATNAQVSGTNSEGEIIYVNGAKIVADGIISYEVSGATINDAAVKTLTEAKVNKLIVKKGISEITTSQSAGATVSLFKTIVAEDGSSLSVGDKVTLNVKDLVVEGATTLDGDITVTNVVVKKEGVLTNNGDIYASAKFENNGTVNNNGSVTLAYGVTVTGNNGTWKYNNPVQGENPNPANPKQDAMDDAVSIWSQKWGNWIQGAIYYAGNPYDYSKFVAVMNNDNYQDQKADLIDAGFSEDNFKTDKTVVEPSEFKAAVDKLLKAQQKAAEALLYDKEGKFILNAITADNTLYENEADVKEAMCLALNAKDYISSNWSGNAVTAAYVWYAQDAVYAAYKAENPYTYIWEGCQLDKVMAEFNKVDLATWKTATGNKNLADITNLTTLQAWMKAVLNAQSGNIYVDAAKEVLKAYMYDYTSWKYEATQITACK